MGALFVLCFATMGPPLANCAKSHAAEDSRDSAGHLEKDLIMRWKLIPFVVAAALVGASVAYSAGFTLSAPPKIAFLYFADKTDGGWTQAFEEARLKMNPALGQKIPFVENVPEVAGKIKPAAETFISRGS